MVKPLTFFEKVWNDHVIADLGEDTCLLQIDRLFLHELSGSVALRELRESGRPIASADQVFTIADHVVATNPDRRVGEARNATAVEMLRQVREGTKALGLRYFDVDDHRQGIVHVVAPERAIALPGLTLVCGDSHTCTIGGIGALAWGIGSTEGVHVLATQTLPQVKPRTMRVNFEGRLAPHVSAKDMVLHLIGTIGANGGIGYACEFAGSTVRDMPVEARLTLCNMGIEFQAKYAFVPPDETTIDYLRSRDYAPKGRAWDEAVAYWRALPSDPGAVYDTEVTIDSAEVRPQITWGTSPQQTMSIDGRVPSPDTFDDPGTRLLVEKALAYQGLEAGMSMQDVAIDVAYIGSCTNARLSDLRLAAEILRGRKVAPGVLAICVPGSTQVKVDAEAEGIDRVFREAGFEWHASGCAMCANGGADRLGGKRVISTTNRNFEGRQGPGTRTHLASPATVAASAIAGRMVDVRQLGA